MSFYNTEEGKIIGHTVHDSNSGICLITSYVHLIKTMKKRGNLTDEKLEEYLDKIKSIGCKRIVDAVDYSYKYFKSKYKESL